MKDIFNTVVHLKGKELDRILSYNKYRMLLICDWQFFLFLEDWSRDILGVPENWL